MIGAVTCSISALGCASAFDASTPAGATMAVNRFGFDLYGRIKADDQNLICSPASAAVALSMASGGARSETEAEMLRVLHVEPTSKADSQASFGHLLAALNGRDGKDGLILRVSDRLWGQRGFSFESSFLDTLGGRYHAPLERVDFAGATEQARLTINEWAAKETHDRIRNLLKAGDVDDDTRFVLTNAVYFKGAWEQPFSPRMTRDLPFAGAGGRVQVRMMAQEGTFGYTRGGGAQLLELPYRGGLSMIVVLPDDEDGLPSVERAIGGRYDDSIAALRPALVDLQLPRWTFSSRIELNAPLIALGMPRAFSRATADFSGMTHEQALHLQTAVQAAFVDVDEVGTEAAAATAVVGGLDSEEAPRPKPIVFHADHPFLFLIRDRATGAVLFLGRVASPAASGS